MSNARVIVHESVANELEAGLRETARVLIDREGFELVRPGAARDTRALVDEAFLAVSIPSRLKGLPRLQGC